MNAQEKRILIVDDEKEFLETIIELLEFEFEGEHLIIDCASNGEEALEKISKNHYHLMVTDMRMPKMDGLELVRQIRSKNNSMSVIVFSGHAGEGERSILGNYGVNSLVKKPHIPELVGSLRNALSELP